MKLADFVLRCLVRRRDRLTISGDLLEAYHDEILPARGPIGARWWYARQILSFISPAGWALVLGVALNGWILVNTAVAPLADDTGLEMPLILAGLLVVAFAVSVRSAKHAGFARAVLAGVVFGVVFCAIGYVAALIRVNVFLDQIRDRADWVGLVARFDASGFTSFRAYANYEYTSGVPLMLAAGVVLGAIGGSVAGLLNRSQRSTQNAQNLST
jgi:hypothetical protein